MNFSSRRTLCCMTTAAAALCFAQGARADDDKMTPQDPLAGISDNTFYVRSPGNEIVLFPQGRVQVDYYGYARPTPQMPENTVLLRRTRLELNGDIGPWFFFYIGGDFSLGPPAAADPQGQAWVAATDDYVGVAPLKNDWVLFQVGQFDAPFSYENRNTDKYFDFIERSITVRDIGEPNNKEVGAMVHGLLPKGAFYYSFAVINGDGQNFKNVDADADIMGRAWFAPFALFDIPELKYIHVGGSFWHGTRGADGLILNAQTTQANFKFFDPKFTGPDGKTPIEIHQYGHLNAEALELELPIAHKLGARVEYVHKQQDIAEDDVTNTAADKMVQLSTGTFKADSVYGEIYAWALGDDRILPEPALQLPTRLKGFKESHLRHGLMFAARIDYLNESIGNLSNNNANANPEFGTTKVVAPEIGVNYWYSRRFRTSFNYVANILSGDAPKIGKLTAGGDKPGPLNGHTTEHEYIFRMAVAL